MALELRFKNGKLIKHWFGRCFIDGHAKVFSLKEPIHGTPPVKDGKITLLGTGSEKFELSRALAKVELEGKEEEARQKGRADHLTERVIESKTGRKVDYVTLAEISQKWRSLPREEGEPSELYLKWCDSVFRRFSETLKCKFLYQVTEEQANAFIDSLKGSRTKKTIKDIKGLLRSAFNALLPVGSENPFGKVIKGKRKRGQVAPEDGGAIGRRPLTPEELEKLLETAQRMDHTLYGLACCAALTSLRIGDVCNLKWESVDLKNGWVRVTTRKTGEPVEIPIFDDRLKSVFESALAEKKENDEFVFPAAEEMYRENPTGITYRGKKLFAAAFTNTKEEPVDVDKNGAVKGGKADLGDILPRVLASVSLAGFAPGKRDRIMDTLRRYAKGDTLREIAEGQKEEGLRHGDGRVSDDMKEAEDISGYSFFKEGSGKVTIRDRIKKMRKRRGSGMNSASLLGWHNLRGTFVTIALSSGVPFEDVAACTGHTFAKTMRDHYYKPTREHTKKAMLRAKDAFSATPKQLPASEAPALPKAKESRVAMIAEALGGLTEEEKLELDKILTAKKIPVKALPAKRKKA
jgi:integrase